MGLRARGDRGWGLDAGAMGRGWVGKMGWEGAEVLAGDRGLDIADRVESWLAWLGTGLTRVGPTATLCPTGRKAELGELNRMDGTASTSPAGDKGERSGISDSRLPTELWSESDMLVVGWSSSMSLCEGISQVITGLGRPEDSATKLEAGGPGEGWGGEAKRLLLGLVFGTSAAAWTRRGEWSCKWPLGDTLSS